MNALLDALKSRNQVVILEVNGGAIPAQMIYELLQDHQGDITLTQPRRALVQSAAQAIASEAGTQVGGLIGYHLSGQRPRTSASTRLTVRVDQSVSNHLHQHSGGVLEPGILIIDRIYERSMAIEVLIGQVSLALKRSPESQVILVSPPKAQHLGEGEMHPITLLERRFPQALVVRVEIDMPSVRNEVSPLPQGQSHTLSTVQIVEDLMAEETPGTILVLLPTVAEVEETARMLGQRGREEVLQYHSRLDDQIQARVWETLSPGSWRIICSTDSLRGARVNGLLYIVDSGKSVRLSENRFGVRKPRVVDVSATDVLQAQRSLPEQGMYVTVGSDTGNVRAYPEPAIQREAVTRVALQIAALGYNLHMFPLLQPFLPREAKAITVALMKIGALVGYSHELSFADGDVTQLPEPELTSLGHQLLRYPTRPEFALVLEEAAKRGVLEEAIILVASLSTKPLWHSYPSESVTVSDGLHHSLQEQGVVSWVTQGVSQAVRNGWHEVDIQAINLGRDRIPQAIRHWFAGGSQSDLAAIIGAVRTFYGLGLDGDNLRQWGQSHYVKLQHVQEVIARATHLARQLNEMGLCTLSPQEIFTQRDYQVQALTQCLIAGFPHWLCWRSRTDSKYNMQGWGGAYNMRIGEHSICPATELIAIISPTNLLTPEWGYDGSFGCLNRPKVQLEETVIPVAAPVEPSWLMSIHPHLISKRTGPARYNETADRVERPVSISWDSQEIYQAEAAKCRDQGAAVGAFQRWLARLHGTDSCRHQKLWSVVWHNRELLREATQAGCFIRLIGYAGHEDFVAHWIRDRVSVASIAGLNIDSLKMGDEVKAQLEAQALEMALEAIVAHMLGTDEIRHSENPKHNALRDYLDCNRKLFTELAETWPGFANWLRSWVAGKLEMRTLRQDRWRSLMMTQSDLDAATNAWIQATEA